MPHKDPERSATKRSADDTHDSNDHDSKRPRKSKGFTVGPAHLPDGAWKRKNQQLKRALIDQAKLKKDYAKLQARETAATADTEGGDAQPAPTAPTMHPDRQTMIDRGPASPEPEDRSSRTYRRRERRPKPAPFAREQRAADKEKAVAEERRKAREEAEAQRNARLEERERFRRAMAKARTGGKNGQRKLGRESGVLLEKVRRMVAEG